MCGEISGQAILDEYGQYYLDSFQEVDCSNNELYSDTGGSSTGRRNVERQDRQLRRDYTPPPTNAIPPTQCSLPKSSSTPNQNAPATTVKHPCTNSTADAITPRMSKALMLSLLAGMNFLTGQN